MNAEQAAALVDPATLAPFDASVVRYWQFWAAATPGAADGNEMWEHVLETDGISTELLTAILEAAPAHVANGPFESGSFDSRSANRAAALNPATPPELLRQYVADASNHMAAARRAAMNPALGPWVAELLDTTAPGAARHLLSNPGADPDFLLAQLAVAPDNVCANPATPAAEVNRLAAVHPGAFAHPGIDPDALREALTGNNGRARIYGALNPTLTRHERQVVLDVELERFGYEPHVATNARNQIARLEWRDNPFAWDAAGVDAYHPLVAARITALGGNGQAAAIAVARSGFAGTIAELLDTAAAVVSEPV